MLSFACAASAASVVSLAAAAAPLQVLHLTLIVQLGTNTIFLSSQFDRVAVQGEGCWVRGADRGYWECSAGSGVLVDDTGSGVQGEECMYCFFGEE